MQSDSALHRARNAYRIGDYSVARELLEQLLESDGSRPQAHILLGSVLAQQGEIGAAAREFSAAIEQDRQNAEAFNNLGIMYRRLGRFGDALKAIRSAINLNPDRADLRYNLANVYKVAGDIDEAAAAYEKAIELDPAFLPAYNNLGNLLAAQGDHTKARDVFQRGLYHDPNHPGLHYNIGLAQEREGDLEAAAESFGRALRSRPGWVDALINRGVVLDRLGRLEESLRSYQEILRIDPENAIAHNNAATIQMQRGELDAAVDHLREALRLNPRYEHAAGNIVRVLAGRDDRDDVPEILGEVVSAFPDRVDFRRARAESLAARDRLWEAEEELQTVLRLEHDEPSALHLLGLVYFRTAREEEAKDCFQRLEAAEPGHHSHRLDLARFFVSEGRYEEAAHELKGYLERVPGDPEGHLLRADILIARGKVDAAVRLLQKLRAEYPEHGAVLSHLARAYREQGEREQALHSAEDLISLQGNRANPEDLSAINESLAIYEDIVSTYQTDHNEAWQRNLEKLGDLAREAEEGEAKEVKAEMEIDELAGLEEDSIPILDFTAEHFEQDAEEEEEPPEEPDWEALSAHQHYPSLLRMAEGERRESPPQRQPAASGAPSYPPPEHPGASPWHNEAEPQYRQPPPPPPYPAQLPPQYPQYPPPQYPPPQYPPPSQTYHIHQQSGQQPPAPPEPALQEPDRQSGEGAAPPWPAPTFVFHAPPEGVQPPEGLAPQTPPSDEDLPAEEEAAPPPEEAPVPEEELPGEVAAAEEGGEDPGEREEPGEPGEPGEEPEDEWQRRAAMFDYLVQLAGDLPEQQNRAFLESDIRLRIETIKARLTGRPGLRADIERYGMGREAEEGGEPLRVTPKRLRDTFGYIQSLSGYHPNHKIADALKTRLEFLMKALR